MATDYLADIRQRQGEMTEVDIVKKMMWLKVISLN
jgi:hypothetical protein